MIGPKTKLYLKRYTSTTDTMGGESHSYSTVETVKGVLSTIRGNERLDGSKMTVIADFNFYMDYPKDYTISERDMFYTDSTGSRKYKIVYINNLGVNQDKRLKITLKEEI